MKKLIIFLIFLICTLGCSIEIDSDRRFQEEVCVLYYIIGQMNGRKDVINADILRMTLEYKKELLEKYKEGYNAKLVKEFYELKWNTNCIKEK